MPAVWRRLRSFFSRSANLASSPRIAIVALIVDDWERRVLTGVSAREPWDVLLVESCDDACAVSNQRTAPVVVFDRDWPDTEWRSAVQKLASSPHRPCVILMSRVADDYLSDELFHQGGYEVLPKPLRAEDVIRVVKLALSYWNSAAQAALARR